MRQLFFDIRPQQQRELAKLLRELRIAADLHVAALQHLFGRVTAQSAMRLNGPPASSASACGAAASRVMRNVSPVDSTSEPREAADVHADAPAFELAGTARARAASAAARDSARSR